MRKRIFVSLLLAVCALFVFAACGETQNVIDGPGGNGTDTDKTSYTVSLTCEDNTAIFNGILVQLKKEDGSVAAEVAPDKSGKAVFSLTDGTYTVNLIEKSGFENMLLDYQYPQKTVSKAAPSVTIDLALRDDSEETVSYRVTVLDKDGNPVADLLLQLCGGPKGMCNPARTNEQGVAEFDLAAGEYEVHIDTPPAGNKFDNTAYKMTAEGGEFTVRLTAA